MEGHPHPSSHLCRDRWGCRRPQGDAASPSSASRMADTHTHAHAANMPGGIFSPLIFFLWLSWKEAGFRWQQNKRAPASLRLAA